MKYNRLISKTLLFITFVTTSLRPIMAQDAQLRGPINLETPVNLKTETESITKLFDEPDNPEKIQIASPRLSALITLDKKLDPFGLDSSSTRIMSLADVARKTIDSNLDIGISNMDQKIRKGKLLSSMGQFLPDPNLGYRYNYLYGTANVPFGTTADPLRFDNSLIIAQAGLRWYLWRGGKVLFSTLRDRNLYKAAQHSSRATINDALLQAARLYYDLLLQEAILQVRIRAVDTSISQLKLNQDQKEGGLVTNLEVLQAQTQLSQDRQKLIDQQIERRDAAIRLSEFLNQPQEIDIAPATRTIVKTRLVSNENGPNQLIDIAIKNRPELKQFEEQRLAAKKDIKVAASKLSPTFQFNLSGLGIGETLSSSHEGVLGLNGAIKQRNKQITPLLAVGYQVNWNLEGMGTVDAANTYAAMMNARKAQLESSKELNLVTSQVRRAYLAGIQTERKIEEAIAQVKSSEEELNLAQIRYQNGLAKNIDVLRAQEDYTEALIQKATSLVNFNLAQVALLRELGKISYDSLVASVPIRN
jgi:outer membrane protein